MEKNKLQHWKRYRIFYMLAGLALLILLTFLGWRWYLRSMETYGAREPFDDREYARHYVMITEEPNSELWKRIYESAKQEGKEQNAWVEVLGGWFADEYSAIDYMKIAVAAKADGIIVKPDGTLRMREAIDAAEAAGVPVVTVLEDDTDSRRRSFVGINSYQLGTTYGGLVLDCMTDETDSVLVLLNGRDAGKSLVYKELKATVQAGLFPGQAVEVRSMTVNARNAFDAEEVIRDIFIEEENRPDILVCMNEADSERAYQAMVDYNCVGDVEIIGFYQSGTMLNAIQKGTVPRAIAIDTEQAGRYCVEALEEYYSMGYVSTYLSVDLNIVTRSNVQEYLPEHGEGI